MPIDLDAYLDRIGYDGPLDRDEATLSRLHQAHVTSIPFENLDVIQGKPIRLDLPSLEAKLVHGRRGGYCFEHGTLFKAVLDRLGFKNHILMSRVRLGAQDVTPRTHMMLRVEAKGSALLADVGFGGEGLLRPLPLLPEIVTHVPGAAYRLRHAGGSWTLEGDIGGNGFVDYYSFTLEAFHPVDLEVANHFCSTHPASRFRHTVTAQMTRPDRRVVLRGRQITRRRNGTVEIEELADAAALRSALETEFGLRLDADLPFPTATADGQE